MKTTSAPNVPTVSHEDISQRARALWLGYGRPDGRDEEIWLEAERQLLGVDPAVEGRGAASVSAAPFDEATTQGKPPSRLEKSASPKKSPAAARAKR